MFYSWYTIKYTFKVPLHHKHFSSWSSSWIFIWMTCSICTIWHCTTVLTFFADFFHWFWKSVLEKDLWHHKHTGANPCLVLTFANVMRHEKFSGAYTDKWLYGQVGNTYWNTLEINMLVCVCVSPVWSFRASCPYQLGLCSSPLATLHINCSS